MTDEQHNILRLVLVDIGFIEDLGETALEFKVGELNECCRLMLHYSPTYHHMGEPVVDAFCIMITDWDMMRRPAPLEPLATSFKNRVTVMTAMKMLFRMRSSTYMIEFFDSGEPQ